MSAPEIAFDLTPLQNAHRHRGIGTYVRGLARRLAAQSDVPLEFWGWAPGVPIEVRPPHRSLLLRRWPMPEYRGAWAFAQIAMRRRAARSTVRCVHVTDPQALVALRGRRMLSTVYDLIPLREGMGRGQLLSRAGYRAYLRALGRTDVLFAISQQTADDIVNLLDVDRSRVRLALPGVDAPAQEKRADDHPRPYFLFLGGPNPNKNLGVLLDAMGQAPDLEPELVIAGHWLPKQVASLEAQLAAQGLHGRVRHVGFVPDDDLACLMRDAVALVVPSLQEGFGLPVAEGLAAGAFVIHSRLPVLEETSHGAALEFDAGSATELAGCLRQAATDAALQKDLRARGLERARALTWDAAVATTLETYTAILRS